MSNWADDMDRAMDENPKQFEFVKDEMGNPVEPGPMSDDERERLRTAMVQIAEARRDVSECPTPGNCMYPQHHSGDESHAEYADRLRNIARAALSGSGSASSPSDGPAETTAGAVEALRSYIAGVRTKFRLNDLPEHDNYWGGYIAALNDLERYAARLADPTPPLDVEALARAVYEAVSRGYGDRYQDVYPSTEWDELGPGAVAEWRVDADNIATRYAAILTTQDKQWNHPKLGAFDISKGNQ